MLYQPKMLVFDILGMKLSLSGDLRTPLMNPTLKFKSLCIILIWREGHLALEVVVSGRNVLSRDTFYFIL